MKTCFAILLFFTAMNCNAQVITLPADIVSGPDIPHEEKWTTGVLSASNVFVSYINIKQMKNTSRRSNAGFLLFPGLIQLSMGSIYKKHSDPTRHIDVAVGASSMLICVARMIYPKKRGTGELSLVPYYLPGSKTASGLYLSWKL
jgi:hypothetical protein